jgi:CheY-like chemotaxis protein
MTLLKNKRILIADDDEVYLKYLTTLMNQSGAQILTVKNGKEALEVIPIQLFDLILIDLKLPDIDGYEVAFQARNTLNINRHTAIVGMSAGEAEEARQITSNMDDVLPKPLNAEGLINRLERVMVFEKTAFQLKNTFHLNVFDFDKRLNALHLKELYGNDTEHAAMMFETFLEESVLQWHGIWTLWETNNLMGIKEKAHRLKPAFSMVGLTQVESKLKDLERSIFAYSQAKLKEILTTIDNVIADFTPILENELERLQCDYILKAA